MEEKILLLGFCAWAGKEIYLSFKGSRAKAAKGITSIKMKQIETNFRLSTIESNLDNLKIKVDQILDEDRKYRK